MRQLVNDDRLFHGKLTHRIRYYQPMLAVNPVTAKITKQLMSKLDKICPTYATTIMDQWTAHCQDPWELEKIMYDEKLIRALIKRDFPPQYLS